VSVLQGFLVGLQIARHAVEAPAEIGELVAAGDGDTIGEIAFGKLGCSAQELGERRAQSPQ